MEETLKDVLSAEEFSLLLSAQSVLSEENGLYGDEELHYEDDDMYMFSIERSDDAVRLNFNERAGGNYAGELIINASIMQVLFYENEVVYFGSREELVDASDCSDDVYWLEHPFIKNIGDDPGYLNKENE